MTAHRAEVWTPDDAVEALDDPTADITCEVAVTCHHRPVCQVETEDGYDFVPFVLLHGSGEDEAPVVVCDDCHGWLQEVYQK